MTLKLANKNARTICRQTCEPCGLETKGRRLASDKAPQYPILQEGFRALSYATSEHKAKYAALCLCVPL